MSYQRVMRSASHDGLDTETGHTQFEGHAINVGSKKFS